MNEPIPDGYLEIIDVLYEVEGPGFIAYVATDGKKVTAVSPRLESLLQRGDDWFPAAQKLVCRDWRFEKVE